MARTQTSIQNMASGELSSKVWGRYDLPAYQHGLERSDNFIDELQGPARFRNGFRHVRTTRRNKIANQLKFQFSNSDAYNIEVTDGYLRFYKGDGIILETAKTITNITKDSVGVITSASHGFNNGDEVYVSGVLGMTGINGRFFLVAGKTTNTFQLTDQDGNNFSTLAYSAYASAGTAARVYEITVPYLEADDLFALRITQNADTCYIVHPKYEPRKLTRTADTSWALALYTRTNDPFLSKKTITATTKANPCKVTSTAHGYATGKQVIIEGIVGMTQLNSRWYTITVVDADNFTLNGVDSTGYGAYVSGGYASDITLLPQDVTFHQGRLCFDHIAAAPLQFVLSRAPDNTGATRYDDYTTGTDADHAVIFSINGEDESTTLWIKSNTRFLLIGAYTGIFKITGGTDDSAITPTSVQALRISAIGVSDLEPVTYDISTIYAEQQNLIVRSLDYNILWQNFLSKDKNLISDHITAGVLKRFAFTSGRPDIAWAITVTGRLIGMTFKIDEEVFGWHRHSVPIGRPNDKFISILALPRVNKYQRLWAIIERPVNGVTRRYMSFLEDSTDIPQPIDFFTGEENKDTDLTTFLRAEYEAKKFCFHLDSGLSYDGSDSTNSPSTISMAHPTGLGIHFYSDVALFAPADVGREIRKKAISGIGTGRAVITSYVSSTEVVCNVIEDFDSMATMAPGKWFFTVNHITNADHLEGCTVSIIIDGATHPDCIVTGGMVTLNYHGSVIHLGLRYTGILKSLNLETGGVDGPSQTKPRNVTHVGLKFFQTAGAKFGTDLYKLEEIKFRKGNSYCDRPPALLTDSIKIPFQDQWAREKHVYIVQEVPLPCNVQLIMPYVDTDNG